MSLAQAPLELTYIWDLSVYSLNPFAIPVFLTWVAIFILGPVVLVRERYSSVGTAFFLMTLSVGVWLFTFSLMYSTQNEAVALWWSKAAYAGLPFIPSTLYYFTLKVLRLYETHKKWSGCFFWVSALFAFVISRTDLIVHRVQHFFWGYYPQYEPLSVLYLGFFLVVMFLSLRLYWGEYHRLHTPTHQARIRSLMIAFGIAYIGVLDYLPKFGLSVYPVGYLGVLGFILITAHVTKHYRLVDITPSLAAEKIIGTMGDALLVLDAEDVIQVANDAAHALFQTRKPGLIGQHIAAVSAGFPLKNTPASIEQMDAERCYEIEHPLPDGQELTFTVSESAMKDHLGCVIATVLILRDVTPIKKTETALRETETRCNELYRQIPDAILLLDEFGRFRSLNPAAERLLGFTERELNGKIFVMSSILPQAYMSRVLRVIRLIMETDSEESFEMQLIRKNGQPIALRAVASGIRHNGKVEAVQILMRESQTQSPEFLDALKKAKEEMESSVRKQLEEFARAHAELKEEIEKIKLPPNL